MGKTKELYRILNRGGVLSPVQFLEILNLAEQAGNQHVHLGSRQDILFYSQENGLTDASFQHKVHCTKRASGIQNLVSSYVCVDILPSTVWIHSGTYLKIIEQFNFEHHLRVNIVDPKQNLVPLFYGNLNFIASEVPNYWHLYVNLTSEKEPEALPVLIFTDDIASFAQKTEQLFYSHNCSSNKDLLRLIRSSELLSKTLESESKPELPTGFYPYYEGLNIMENKNEFWAGFYWRNNAYPVEFLREVCQLCMNTNIGRISFTPWKTFLIKDIRPEDKIRWEELIGRFGINMRHSSFELNWHLPLLNKKALKLKQYLISEFDKLDIRTYGLSFTIQDEPAEKFTSVVIQPESRLPFLGKFDFTKTYKLEYAFDFNPNSNNYIEYAANLDKSELAEKLNEISKRYYAQLFAKKTFNKSRRSTDKTSQIIKVFQCPDCKNIYDERYGDALTDISPGTAFSQLSNNYNCPVCEAPKTQFSEIEIKEVIN